MRRGSSSSHCLRTHCVIGEGLGDLGENSRLGTNSRRCKVARHLFLYVCTQRRAGTMSWLERCWYVSNVSIIFDCSMLVLYHYYMFLMFCISENPLCGNSSELDKNLRNYFCNESKTESRGPPEGPPRGQGRPPATVRRWPTVGTRPCSWWVPSDPSDAYKILIP